MTIRKEKLAEMLSCTAEYLQENSDRLSEIDSKFGDGDHGVTVFKIAGIILEHTAAWTHQPISDFLYDLGEAVTNVGGGSAGPLWGTMLGGLYEPAENHEEIDAVLLKKMLRACLTEMEEITTARVGDKTMMDALIPAVERAEAAPNYIVDVLEAAAKGALEGAKASEGFVSKYGRARSYKEQTIGTPDAGATSVSLFFEGLWKAYN